MYCNVPKVALFHRNLSGPPLPGHLTLAFACFPKRGDVPKGSMVTLFHRNLSGPRKRCVLQRPKGFHGGSFPQEPFWAPVARPSHTGVCVLSEKGGGGCPEGNVSGRSRFRLAPAPGGISPMRPRPLGAQIPHCFIGFSSCARPGRCIRHSD